MKKFRGFTLIECLIAMFILGISSLLLCQGYTQLMRLTNRTNTITASIGQQMLDAESYEGTGGSSNVKKIIESQMEVTLMDTRGQQGDKGPQNKLELNKVTKRDYAKDDLKYSTTMTVYEVIPYGYSGTPHSNKLSYGENKDGTEMRYVYFHS